MQQNTITKLKNIDTLPFGKMPQADGRILPTGVTVKLINNRLQVTTPTHTKMFKKLLIC